MAKLPNLEYLVALTSFHGKWVLRRLLAQTHANKAASKLKAKPALLVFVLAPLGEVLAR